MTLLNTLKTITFLSIILYAAPFLIENIKKQYVPLLEPQTKIGILTIKESINEANLFINQLHSFFKNSLIKGIIIKIDATASAPGSSQTIFHDIRQLKKEYPKPIIALIENKCLAGSYLIASACDYIIAPESAITGNIGPSFIDWSTQEISQDLNNSFDNIKHETYQQLIKQIAMSRKLSLTTTHSWANGKIFTATQAITLGLINEIGSLCTAIKTIKEKALIEGEIEWIEPCKNTATLNVFFSNDRTIP